MLLKIIVGCIVVVICSLVGVKIADKRKEKRDIFGELIIFCDNFLYSAQLFNKSVIEHLQGVNGELEKTLQTACESLKNGDKFKCSDKRLNNNEKELVEGVINSLGKSDIESQKATIEMYVERIKSQYLTQENDYQKFSKLYLKLGFACGLIIMVLMF